MDEFHVQHRIWLWIFVWNSARTTEWTRCTNRLLLYEMCTHHYLSTFAFSFPKCQISLDVVALNKINYRIQHSVLSLHIAHKTMYAVNTVQMKVDNFNWVQLTADPGRVEDLKNIFRIDLWPESKNDLKISFMESAVKMGGRVPVKPHEKVQGFSV